MKSYVALILLELVLHNFALPYNPTPTPGVSKWIRGKYLSCFIKRGVAIPSIDWRQCVDLLFFQKGRLSKEVDRSVCNTQGTS